MRSIAGLLIVILIIGTSIAGCTGEKIDDFNGEINDEYDESPLEKTVLVFSPHPDDGEIFAGGAICYHVSELGEKAVEIFMTSGEAGGDPIYGRSGQELIDAREAEARNASKIVGINETEFLHFPDGGILYNETTFAAVKSSIEKHHPYLIYVTEYFGPVDTHPDHVTTGIMVYDAVEKLSWKDKPSIRFYDDMVKPDANNAFVDITSHLPAKASALMEYESQGPTIFIALSVLNAVYVENSILAGKPGTLCEGFREVAFASGRNIIMDFNGIESPSSTNKAWYKNTEKAEDNCPPTTGPEIEGSAEFTADMYNAISKSDNIRAETGGAIWKRTQSFKVMAESTSGISEFYVRWEGYGKPNAPAVYIWNFDSGGWELVGSLGDANEGLIEKTFVDSPSAYFNETGYLYLSAINTINGSLDALGVGAGNQIDTDYLKVRLTLGEVE